MRNRKWLRWAAILALVWIALSAGISSVLRTRKARRYLTAHLEASFGRPVEVDRFTFSLLDGPRLSAERVTVAEDPRFGQEYFLRAGRLTASPRWLALLAGRFEFGRLSLEQPSLNLVRDASGRWNIESWLPPAAPSTRGQESAGESATKSGVAPTARLYRIDIDGGRIDFKQGDDKSPFALVDLSGRLDQIEPGRWGIDLEALPFRAGVELQEAGTLRLRGTIAGTSARLQPAQLTLTWREASLADAIRLARGLDLGARGQIVADLSARVEPPSASASAAPGPGGAVWSVAMTARLTGVHGWRLPERSGDPSANLAVQAQWRTGDAHAQLASVLLEMPRSHLRGTGTLDWSQAFRPDVHFVKSEFGLGDLLAWYQAFRPGIADDLSVDGVVGLDASLGGWPITLERGALASVGARVTSRALAAPLRIGAINASVAGGGLDFAPTKLDFEPSRSAAAVLERSGSGQQGFSVRGLIAPANAVSLFSPWEWDIHVDGETSRAEDWRGLGIALAQPIAGHWNFQGGVTIHLRSRRTPEASSDGWSGTADLQNFALAEPLLNQPLRFSKTHVEFGPSGLNISSTAAEGLGAMWTGTVRRSSSAAAWEFDLTADRLDAAQLARWLDPRARAEASAARPFLAAPVQDPASREAAIAQISAHGRLRAGAVLLGPLQLDHLDAGLEIAGRYLKLHGAKAGFYGGNVTGEFEAQLLATPGYEFRGKVERVDLARLGRATSSLANRFAGLATGSLELGSNGVGRADLMNSLVGLGNITVRNPDLRGLNFPASAGQAEPFRMGSIRGEFVVRAGQIRISDAVLQRAGHSYRATGSVNFSRTLDIGIFPPGASEQASPAAATIPAFLLRGTISAPRLERVAPASKAPAAAPKKPGSK